MPRFAVLPATPPDTLPASVIVHAGESWYQDVALGRFDFFEKLGHRAQEEGLTALLAPSESAVSAQLLQDRRHVHILIGPRAPIGPGILHAHPGYLRGFWYLDPVGVNMASSLIRRAFKPDQIDAKAARFFFNGVAGWNLRQNVSKFPQAERRVLPAAFATLFLQDIEHFASPVHYIETTKMLKLVAREADGARVYVKLHPLQRAETVAWVQQQARKLANLVISDASVHDLAQAAQMVVTQNSAAGFEALMQKKPVITCAQCDYHHATVVANRPALLVQALHSATLSHAGFDYEKYLYWFLAQNLLEPAKPEFPDLAWARIKAAQAAALA
ncbi:capsular polysaccharide export protein, LipB/KpsS family [Cypionkella sinensis]|uniref:Capsule polysaccharide biosynthesis protein n=1 Tax=Cypionkella sinensis TaxID=1756043 RepID=A0ABV7J2A4_9RHOB